MTVNEIITCAIRIKIIKRPKKIFKNLLTNRKKMHIIKLTNEHLFIC